MTNEGGGEYNWWIYIFIITIMEKKFTSEQQNQEDITNVDQIKQITQSGATNTDTKENKPIIKAPETISDAKDLVTAIKAKHQENKEELTKLKGTSEASKRVMEMIEKRPPDVQWLISHASDVIVYIFELLLQWDSKWETWVINEILGYDFDISQIKTEEDAQRWINELTQAINDVDSDVIERFIMLHSKSRIIDKQLDLKYAKEWKDISNITKKERLLQTIQPWDLVLIDYRNTKNVEAELTNQALKGLSKSAFCHVGFVWENKTLYHSTMAKSDGWSGVEKRSFSDYLDSKGDCLVMVIRPKDLTSEQKQQMISRAENHVSSKKWYDTKAAVSNLSWWSIKEDGSSYNCWEYVFDILSSIYPKMNIKNSALPESYTSQKQLDWHYLSRIKAS